LKPRSEDSGFEFMRLAMEGSLLRAMEMIDSFGQTTRLYFNEITRNPQLSERDFVFTPPPGVDVIGDTGSPD
jgi:outer membrane lipoprotein carrier protein